MDKGSWQIAVLFVGAALGGTYLGGYEWLHFFAYFGSWGTIGVVLSSLGLGWFGYSAVVVCHRHGLRSLHDLYLHWFGEAIGPSLSVLTHFFLLAYTGIMIGQQAIQWTGQSLVWPFVILPFLIACIFLMRGGWKSLVKSISVSLAIGFFILALIFFEQRHVPIPHFGYQMNLNWIVHAILYMSMHFLLCLVMTIPLAARQPHERVIRFGASAGVLAFFVFVMLGQAILLAYWHDVHAAPIPLKQVVLQLIPYGDWLLAFISLVHGGILIALLVYSLSIPIAIRHDLHLKPLFMTMFGIILLFALLPLALPWSIPVIASGAAYLGLLLIIGYIWKRQTQQK